MRVKSFFCLLFSFILFSQVHAASGIEAIDALIAAKLPNASVGMVVKDLKTDKIVYAHHPQTLEALASGTKLLTAAAALYQLGADYHFLTKLAQKGKDYYLSFSGSPSFTEANLDLLLQQLQARGISVIEGDIIVDSSRFRAPEYPDGLSMDDLGWDYAAPDSAIIINENTEAFQCITGESVGMPVSIQSLSKNPGLQIINDLKTATQEEAEQHCSMHIALKAQNTLHLFGCLPKGDEPTILNLAIPEPFLYLKQLIALQLSKRGITLKGEIKSGYTPANAKTLLSFQSDDLQQLVSHMLKKSDNIYANSLTKLLGHVLSGEGSTKQGVYAIKKILTQHSSVDFNQMVLRDGMGTRYNLATAAQMVTLAQDLYRNDEMQSLILAALPQAGVSGTLKNRFKKTPLEGNLFAKTGSMHDISSISGYIISPKGAVLAFSLLINGLNMPKAEVKQIEQLLLLAVNEHFT